MDIPSFEPHCHSACRPVLAALVSLLTAATAAAQEYRPPGSSVSYALSTSMLRSPDDIAEQSRVELVRWKAVGDNAWGMGLGASRDGNSPLRPGLGLHWRSRITDRQRLDLSAWRHFDNGATPSLSPDGAPAEISTRIELQFASPRRSATFGEGGVLGMQLSSTSKVSMRLRGGRPMVYYRMQF